MNDCVPARMCTSCHDHFTFQKAYVTLTNFRHLQQCLDAKGSLIASPLLLAPECEPIISKHSIVLFKRLKGKTACKKSQNTHDTTIIQIPKVQRQIIILGLQKYLSQCFG